MPCYTMQYHASLVTADGAYHCPVGSIMAIFYLRFTIKSKQNALPSTLCPCCGSYLPQSRFCSCPQIFALHHRQGSHQTLKKHWNEYLLIVLFFFTWIKTLVLDDCLQDSLFFLWTHISSSTRRKWHRQPHINIMS